MHEHLAHNGNGVRPLPRIAPAARIFALTLIATAAAAAALGETIAGNVTDAQNGNTLTSMVAAAYGPDPSCSTKRVVCWKLVANATTGAAGRYTLDVAPGSYRVLAYDPAGRFATEFSGGAESFDVTTATAVSGLQGATVNFALRPAGTISGTVITSGGVRAGMTVAAYNLSGTRRGFGTTDAAGAYSFVVPAGSYKLVAYDEAGTFATAFFRDRSDFTGADLVPVIAGSTFSGVDFALPIGARFSGIVTDMTGVPFDGATVIAYTMSGMQMASAFTGPDGRFAMTLRPGTYRFVATDISLVYATEFLGGASSFENSQALTATGGQIRNDLSFKMELGGRFSGRVTDARNGTAIKGVTVAAYNADGSQRASTTSAADGGYELVLPSGSFTMAAYDSALVYAAQFYPQQNAFRLASPVTSSPGSSATLQPFALQHAGRFAGVVTDEGGTAVAGAVVAAYDNEGYPAGTGSTDASGRYRFAVAPGSYMLLAYDPQLRFAVAYAGAANFDTAPVRSISEGAEQSVNFSLQRGTRVSGRVTDSSSRPAATLEVTAYDLSQKRIASATTSSDGTFQMALAPGAYKFAVRDPAGRYITAYFGGVDFASATTVNVEGTGAPAITMTVRQPVRRRGVRH